jgi:hypothetical protein
MPKGHNIDKCPQNIPTDRMTKNLYRLQGPTKYIENGSFGMKIYRQPRLTKNVLLLMKRQEVYLDWDSLWRHGPVASQPSAGSYIRLNPDRV